MSLVRVEDLSVRLGKVQALAGIRFQVDPGEIVAIVGHNGAGKSTLLKSLTGLVLPERGTIEVLGHTLNRKLSRRQLRGLRAEVGQVFQGLHLVPRLTVLENVLIGRLARNRSFYTWARLFSREDHRSAREALSLVGMEHRAEERVDRLSGGERQKVAMARALAQEPRLLLADEPTANLDPRAALEIAALLRSLAVQRGVGVVSVVHTLSLLPVLGGRVLGLKAGRVEFECVSASASEDLLQGLYVGEKGGPVEPMGKSAASGGV